MTILFVSDKHPYREHQGSERLMADYYHTYMPLEKIAKARGHVLLAFWVDEEIHKGGLQGMNDALLAFVREKKPDVCYFNSGNEYNFQKATLSLLKELSVTVSVSGDDSWAFHSMSKPMIPYFSYMVTSDEGTLPKYKKYTDHAFYSPLSVNTDMYCPGDRDRDIDVSFVGTWSEAREKTINEIRNAGIDILVRGNGWPGGAVNQAEMIDILQRSKIAVTLGAPFHLGAKPLARLFLKKTDKGVVLDIKNFPDNFRTLLDKRKNYTKGRHIEGPACGTFIIDGTKDIPQKIRYFLEHPEERKIPEAYSTEDRLYDIFAKVGKSL